MLKSHHRLLFFALIIALIAGVGFAPAAAQSDEGFVCPQTGGTLVMAYGGDPRTLNPLYAQGANDLFATTLLSDPLILGGADWGSSIEPALAESWDISEDGLTYTFHLRQDVTWHDGEPFTSEDVVFTFNAVLQEDNTVLARANLLQGDTPIQVEATDDYTVVFTLNQPDATILTALGIPMLPAHAFDSTSILDTPYNTAPIGTGPFKVVAWNTGENLELAANPDYWRGAPCVDRIVVRFIEGADNLANALLAGEIDYAPLDGTDLTPFQDTPDFQLVTITRDLMRYIGINTQSPIYSDPVVRRALSYGVDRQAIIDTAAGGFGIIPDSIFTKTVFMYEEGRNQPYDYDPEQAQALLAEAGWTDSDGDGILDKDGTPMTMKLVYYGPWPLMQAIGPIVYDNYRSLGIDVELVPLDEGAAFEQIYNNQDVEKPYDATLDGWGLYGAEPDNYRQYMVNETGLFAYNNPEITALFDQGAAETDLDARYEIYSEADRLLWDDLPMIPLFQAIGVWGVSSNINIEAAEPNGTFINGLKYPGRIYLNQ